MSNDNFKGNKQSGIPRARAKYLNQALQLEERTPSKLISAGIVVTAVLLVSAVVWASITPVNEVTHAEGDVIPAGYIHDIQHLEGGIVKTIHVHNGDTVKAGETLMTMSPSVSFSEYEQTMIREAKLAMEAERISALIRRHIPEFGDIALQYPKLADIQRTIYQAQLNDHQAELRLVDTQIVQKEKEIKRHKNQAKSIDAEISLLQQQVNIRKKLSSNQMVSKTELLSTQSRLAETLSDKRKIIDDISVAETALLETQQKRDQVIKKFHRDLELQYGETESNLEETRQTVLRLADKVKRLEIESPVNGIVQGLTVTSINAVIQPGQILMKIVPIDDELIVKARIKPQDIGHIHVGQEADVKITSYDSSRFGSVKGNVHYLSASTYLDPQGVPYYQAEIILTKSYVGDVASKLKILPGMTVLADIKTGTKSILDYLMKPVSRGFNRAFSER